MERLIKHTWILAVLAAIWAGFLHARPDVHGQKKNEQELAALIPATVESYRFIENPETPGATYRMDEVTYELLQPFGIVARVYESEKRGQSIDVVLIAGDNRDTFHDPRICFAGQGWQIMNEQRLSLVTPQGKNLPLTVVSLANEEGRRRIAAYLWKAPGGYYGDPRSLSLAIMKAPFVGQWDMTMAFYRFMPITGFSDQQELLDFIGKFMDDVRVYSEGYF